jgi:hypothetical protein
VIELKAAIKLEGVLRIHLQDQAVNVFMEGSAGAGLWLMVNNTDSRCRQLPVQASTACLSEKQ